MAVTIAPLNDSSQIAEFSRLLDRCFSVPQGASFLEDFPIWNPRFRPSGAGRLILGAFEEGRLRASAGCRVAELLLSSGETARVALIGAVATAPESRGKGLASALVEQAVEWGRSQGSMFALLWGSEHALYRRQGFELSGQQTQVPLKRISLAGAPSIQVSQGWVPTLFELVGRRDEGLQLDTSDRQWYSAHRNVEWYWSGSPEAPSAYVAYGRGIDLGGVVHQWGGDLLTVKALLGAVRVRHPEAVLLAHPTHLAAFGMKAATEAIEPLCLAKILEPGVSGGASELLRSLWIWGLDAA